MIQCWFNGCLSFICKWKELLGPVKSCTYFCEMSSTNDLIISFSYIGIHKYQTSEWIPIIRFNNFFFLDRYTEISNWRMSTNHQNCVKHAILTVRIKWTICKSYVFLPWPNLMLVSSNAIKALRKSVWALQKQTTSGGWVRFAFLIPFLFYCFSVVINLYLFIFLLVYSR